MPSLKQWAEGRIEEFTGSDPDQTEYRVEGVVRPNGSLVISIQRPPFNLQAPAEPAFVDVSMAVKSEAQSEDFWNSPRFKRQKAEFDAMEKLVALGKSQPAIVDDAYPEWRFEYERAASDYFKCRAANIGEQRVQMELHEVNYGEGKQ